MATHVSFSAIVPEVLTKDNYANWSVYIKNYLMSLDLWDVIDTDYKEENEAEFKTWRKKNAAALHAIQITCGPDIFSQIREFNSAKVAWKFLSKMNEPQSQGEVSESEKQQSQGEANEPEKPQSQREVGESEKPQSQGEANEPEKPQSQGEVHEPKISSGTENRNYFPLRKAVAAGNWEAAKRFLDEHPGAVTELITEFGETALHLAVIAGHEKIVKELVQLMSEQDLETTSIGNATALLYAAVHNGTTSIAQCMVEKNKKLVSIGTNRGTIPVVVAAVNNSKDVMRYLYSVTPLEDLTPERGHNGARLLIQCIGAEILDVALDLLKRCPRLAVSPDTDGNSPLLELANSSSKFPSGSRLVFWQRWVYSSIRVQPAHCFNCLRINVRSRHEGQIHRGNIVKPVSGQLHGLISNLLQLFGIKQIYERKLVHLQSLELLRLICKEMPTFNASQLKEGRVDDAIFVAVRNGIIEFITEITEVDPNLIWIKDMNGRHIFMCAIVHRQENIFSLIHAFDSMKESFASRHDKFNNYMSHLAGFLAPSNRLDHISGAALQMQRELLWFKEVESIVPAKFGRLHNSAGKTHREYFTENHKDLVKEGEKWMKEMASSCTFVAALIVTIMFAAAISLPGGYNGDTGFPLFLEKKLFMVFIVSDAISFFSSSTSVLIFLGILTSRYAEEYFLKSLPTKMILGLTTLLISIAAMMVTFCTALFVILQGKPSWIFVLIILLAIVPITLFVLLQSPLLVEIFMSTYGPSIFDRKTKRWY